MGSKKDITLLEDVQKFALKVCTKHWDLQASFPLVPAILYVPQSSTLFVAIHLFLNAETETYNIHRMQMHFVPFKAINYSFIIPAAPMSCGTRLYIILAMCMLNLDHRLWLALVFIVWYLFDHYTWIFSVLATQAFSRILRLWLCLYSGTSVV